MRAASAFSQFAFFYSSCFHFFDHSFLSTIAFITFICIYRIHRIYMNSLRFELLRRNLQPSHSMAKSSSEIPRPALPIFIHSLTYPLTHPHSLFLSLITHSFSRSSLTLLSFTTHSFSPSPLALSLVHHSLFRSQSRALAALLPVFVTGARGDGLELLCCCCDACVSP